MKRTPPKMLNPHDVTSHYTYFAWVTCSKCHEDFRRENGVSWLWFKQTPMYLCQECSHNGNISWTNEHVEWLYQMYRYNAKPPIQR